MTKGLDLNRRRRRFIGEERVEPVRGDLGEQVFEFALVAGDVAAWPSHISNNQPYESHFHPHHRRFSQVPAASGICGAEVAAAILASAGIRDVEIVEHGALLGDHYDPLHKRLVLSGTCCRC